MIIIMRATLHDPAPNTQYGQWPEKKALFPGIESPAIAHNERVASGRFVTFDVPERDFPEIARRCVGNFCVDQKEKSARLAKRASGDDHAAHRFSQEQAAPSL